MTPAPCIAVSLYRCIDRFLVVAISISLLRDTIDVIAEPLANIFNLSLRTAIFPDDWKLAKISPIFKNGIKNEITDQFL